MSMPYPVQSLLRCGAILMCFVGYILTVEGQTTSNNQAFIENKGQWPDGIKFKADVPNGMILIYNSKVSYFLKDFQETDPHDHIATHFNHNQTFTRIDVEFEGANKNALIKTKNQSITNYNYYLGEKKNWAENCKAFQTISFQNLYKDIDLEFYFNKNGSLKYDLILQPGANPAEIKFKYSKNTELHIEDGCSFISANSHSIMENRPVSYAINSSGRNIPVQCQFKLNSKNEIGFEINDHNPSQKVVIDPELVFSTFSGAGSDNFGYTACFDDLGSLYSGGIVFGQSFPETNGSSFSGGSTDMAILKYTEDGSNLHYATFIGGSSEDSPHSLVVNNQRELVIMGSTGSPNYPVSDNAYDQTFNGGESFAIFGGYTGADIVVTKLNQNGNISASTYVGGSGNDGILKMNAVGNYINDLITNYGDYQRGDVIIDSLDNIYVASSTESSDFPITSSIQPEHLGGNSDAIIFSLNSDLNEMRWSTFLGGSQDDAAHSIKINSYGDILVGGGTTSSNFPVTLNTHKSNFQGIVDGFITRMSVENDSIINSTFLGTVAYDQVYFIDVDDDNNVYATGQTHGNYPVSSGAYVKHNSAQFIHKFDSSLTNTKFSTVFGSGTRSINISPTAFLANDCENIFLSGWGGNINSNNGSTARSIGNTFGMAVTEDAIMNVTDGSDFYLLVLSADGSELMYASYFGAKNTPGDHVDGGTSRFDKQGIIYQSVCTCGSSGDDFPTTSGAWSTTNGARCNNASFKFDLASLQAGFSTNSLSGLDPGLTSGCTPLEIVFTNTSVGGLEFFWNLGDGTTSTDSLQVIHTYELPGEYEVTLLVLDETTCKVQDIETKIISVFDDEVSITDSLTICQSEQIMLEATGGSDYLWSPSTGLNDTLISNPIANPDTTTMYTVQITTPNGCEKELSVNVEVTASLKAQLSTNNPDGTDPGLNSGCVPLTVSFANLSTNYASYLWDFGDGNTNTENQDTVIHTYEVPGTYNVTLTVKNDTTCTTEEIASEIIQVFDDPVSISPEAIICESENTQLIATGGQTYTWTPTTGLDDPNSATPTASPNSTTEYGVEIITDNGCVQHLFTNVIVIPEVENPFLIEPVVKNCNSITYQFIENLPDYEGNYHWDFGDGTSSTDRNPQHQYENSGIYTISLDLDHDCLSDYTQEVNHGEIFIPNAFSPNGDGYNDYFVINSELSVDLTIIDRNGKELYQSNNYSNDWGGDNLPAGTYYYIAKFSENSDSCKGWIQLLK